jgi:hypothetical protein
MKKFFYLSALSLLLAGVGCSNPETDPQEPVPATPLELSVYELDFEYDEMLVDKTVEVTGGADEFEMSIVYADPDNADWVDYAADGRIISVAVTSRNTDPEELPRVATLTVKSGEESKEVKITQASYIETDFAIEMAAEGLTFAASGKELTKTIEAVTKVALTEVKTVDGSGADVTVDWITDLSFDGLVVSVTVAANEDYENGREATVAVKNRGGQTATFTVTQDKRPPLDIAGTWSWTSKSAAEANDAGWAAAETVTGMVTIEAIAGGYQFTAVSGNLTQLYQELITADPTFTYPMRIRQADNKLYAGMYEDLNIGTATAPSIVSVDLYQEVQRGQWWCKGVNIEYADFDDNLNPQPNMPITHSVEGDTEKLTYATEYSNGTETGIVSYYFYKLVGGRNVMRHPYDFHREIVLTRTIE